MGPWVLLAALLVVTLVPVPPGGSPGAALATAMKSGHEPCLEKGGGVQLGRGCFRLERGVNKRIK
ncbi:hypothetical protein MYSTI_02582 [Myxococcus stipitatus DSM 14675]|uniref:Uncharacterized protein n=1 Tax=Myxococcus stipitatus (strain DSM 14675 / JCM 12634 / Mx s8) TaxID=1278073 RepID=L7U732_MYXSD|nr:hypothetical protein [Myxococcus stipitatus]AGC43898.1 hypothetical protein MYSTI_02582 [Myxococcus stipitatus DSM 14675]